MNAPAALPRRSAEAPVGAGAMRCRLRLDVRGAVQGVGFRPFVYRLATELELDGWVLNDPAGVTIELEGARDRLVAFADRLTIERPPRAVIVELEQAWVPCEGATGFTIRHSGTAGARTAVVLPDAATCDDCLAEVLAPADRRRGYAFTNCTNCGPRYSIIRALPYDRPNTTMRGFVMCPACEREYGNPRDRRFHAQPNACPTCGPRLSLWDGGGFDVAAGDDDAALEGAARAIIRGDVVAVKGIGGFLLCVNAQNEAAVQRLRARKHRPAKPLALMVANVAQARALCEISPEEEALLRSAEAPIVLLRRRPHAGVARSVAPGMRRLGIMLAYAPLHHLLLERVGRPIVATSANLSEEPICIEQHEAVHRLRDIADFFLVHDRPIERHVDDSVGWILRGAPQVLRRARGYAPMPVRLPTSVPALVAVGGHQKNAIALAAGRQAFISQHIGDLATPESLTAFDRVIRDLARLYDVAPTAIAHDLHPEYASTAWAAERAPWSVPRIGVQHHHAHLASCLADNGITTPALGIVWDGSGFGGDGTVWGGECLVGDARDFARVAHLAPFRLIGGEAAVREPRRCAAALLWEVFGDDVFARDELAPIADLTPGERRTFASMLRAGVRSPVTTSAGRLFDGVAALLGLAQRVRFEGEAAMALEHVADPSELGAYPLPLVATNAASPALLDWRPMIGELLADLRRGAALETMAARFHNALVQGIVGVAQAAAEPRVALTGGCFQNHLLVTRAASALEAAGFEVLLHRNVPPNDGGICLGQIAVAAARLHSDP